MTKKSEGDHEHEFDGFTFEDIEKDFKFLADELTGKGVQNEVEDEEEEDYHCLLYTSPSPRDRQKSRMPSSA